ncbi:AAA domain family protein [Mycobacterium xenopi 3993]|nr:AAA domain family protein [Mycobacterium xenopi 3993]
MPAGNLAEASLVDGIDVWGVRTLGQLQTWLGGEASLDGRISAISAAPESAADLADVVGQAQARFAVEVAAAGGHHLMLTGPPGVGKTMLAQRLPACCRRCRQASRWKSPRFTRWPGCCRMRRP